jgi:hypothetical protein
MTSLSFNLTPAFPSLNKPMMCPATPHPHIADKKHHISPNKVPKLQASMKEEIKVLTG